MIEVLIWVFAIRYIFQNLDEVINLFGYAIGFGIGNVLGITIEQKIGLGFAQLNIISRSASVKLQKRFEKKIWCNCSPSSRGFRRFIIAFTDCTKKESEKVIALIESIDNEAFITVQHSLPYRGFIHGARK